MTKLKQLWIILGLIVVAIICILTFPLSGFAAADGVNMDVAVDAGFTLLEQILIFTGIGGGALAGILIKVARQGTKALLNSLHENPYVSNQKIHLHAKRQQDKKVMKLLQNFPDV